MADRIQEPLVRSTVRIMTTDTGVRTRLNISVLHQELFPCELMTAAAQLSPACIEHALNIGTMGTVALHAVPYRRFMGHAFAPELRHLGMTA